MAFNDTLSQGKCINKNNSEAFVKAVEKVFQVHGIDNVEYVVGASDAEQNEEGLTIIMFNPVEYCDNKSVKQLLKLIDSLRDEHEIQTWLENKQFIRMLFERYIPKKCMKSILVFIKKFLEKMKS